MSKLFDGNHHSFRVEEATDWTWPEVTVVLPGFAIDSIRNALPPFFRGTVSWESTDIEKIRLFIPTPTPRLGQPNQEVLCAQKAFSTAVDLAQKSVERMLGLKGQGGSTLDTWILAPSQWMYQVWRFRCSTLDLETLPYELHRLSATYDYDETAQKEAEYATWLAKEIESWVEDAKDE